MEEKLNNIIGRGVTEIITKASLEKKLLSGKKLRIKFGVDPSSPDIHIGHAVPLWQLKRFQDAGHTVIFLIGDYTARIGDPSGKNKTRPVLTEKEIKANAKTYLKQVGRILDIKKAEIRYNSEWLKKLSFADLLVLGSSFSVSSIIERDDFEKRLKSGAEIAMHELFYPMMQAYDSVALKADVEMGGTDQMFNLLAGRELQSKIGQPKQEVVMMELLVGLDGKEKMSKSLGNYVGITDDPDTMFGKIMSIPDTLILQYFKLCTNVADDVIAQYETEMKDEGNPRDYKEKLAHEITALYHSKDNADSAKVNFILRFRNKEVAKNIPEIKMLGAFDAATLIVNLGFAESKTQARRLVEQGALSIDGLKVSSPEKSISCHDGMIVKVGKLKIVKIVK